LKYFATGKVDQFATLVMLGELRRVVAASGRFAYLSGLLMCRHASEIVSRREFDWSWLFWPTSRRAALRSISRHGSAVETMRHELSGRSLRGERRRFAARDIPSYLTRTRLC